MSTLQDLRERRRVRLRFQLRSKSGGRPRLSVFRSGKHIYAQVIDDGQGRTLAAASSLDKTLREGQGSTLGGAAMTAHAWAVLALGFLVSFGVAYAVVAWFMGWVRRRGFAPFAVWRILAGAAVLLWMTGGGGAN